LKQSIELDVSIQLVYRNLFTLKDATDILCRKSGTKLSLQAA